MEYRPKYWIIVDGLPTPTDDLLEWGHGFASGVGRQVARTEVRRGVVVSTVFLGLDHNWGEGPPLLWETMIFGGPHDQYQVRYSTRADAEAGHLEAVRLARTASRT